MSETRRLAASGQWGKHVGTASVGVAVMMLVVSGQVAHETPELRIVAGGVLLVAGLLFYFYWRVTPTSSMAWTVAATVLLATQVVARAALDAASAPDPATATWAGLVDLATCVLALALLFAATRVTVTPDPLLLGLALGVVLSAVRGLGPAIESPLVTGPLALSALALLVLVGHAAVALYVWRGGTLPIEGRARLAGATALVGGGQFFSVWLGPSALADITVSLAVVTAAILWLQSTLRLMAAALEGQHAQAARLERALSRAEADARTSREVLHEVRSMVAGISSATRLLHDHDVEDTTRIRLEGTIQSELDRLQRVVSERSPGAPATVDLDETLDQVLEAHRARGRTIEWQPSGAQVRCRPDDVAEVLDILLDNAATHGQGGPSHVDVSPGPDEVRIVVTDHGPGVPDDLRDHIFDWGFRGSRSRGEGIGLHRARRLVSEHGGTLTLAPGELRGSAFVIRLPAARRAPDGDGCAGR